MYLILAVILFRWFTQHQCSIINSHVAYMWYFSVRTTNINIITGYLILILFPVRKKSESLGEMLQVNKGTNVSVFR